MNSIKVGAEVVAVVDFTTLIGVQYLAETRFTIAVVGSENVVMYPINVPGWSTVRVSRIALCEMFRNLDRCKLS